MDKITKFERPRISVRNFSDSDRYKGGFGVKSQSSDKIYKISFDAAKGALYWVCSCPGCIIHGQCKHLTACGLKGRKFGHQLGEARKYGWLS